MKLAFQGPDCGRCNHVDLTVPLPDHVLEALRAAPHTSAGANIKTRDTLTLLPDDFYCVKKGEVLAVEHRGQVLKEVQVPREQPLGPVAADTDLSQYAQVGALERWDIGVLNDLDLLTAFVHKKRRWPEEDTDEYAAYRARFAKAVDAYAVAHAELVAVLAENPLEPPAKKQRKE